MSPEEDGILSSAWALPGTPGSVFPWLSSDVSTFCYGSPTLLLACSGTPSPLALILSTFLAFCTPWQRDLAQDLPEGHASAQAAVSPHPQGPAQLQLVLLPVLFAKTAKGWPIICGKEDWVPSPRAPT